MPSPEMTNFTPPVVKPKKNDNRVSVVSMEEKKNMPHCNKFSLCSNNGLPSTSSDDTCILGETSYNSNISTLTKQKRKHQHIYVEDSAVELNCNNKRGNTDKKPCKQWQRSEHSSMFSLSLQDKSTGKIFFCVMMLPQMQPATILKFLFLYPQVLPFVSTSDYSI